MKRILALLAGVHAILPCLVAARDRTDLNVAIFAYLPDSSAAIERLEASFEQKYPSIDLDLDLWNPYDDAFEDDGLSQMVNFDLVEVDLCRIDELIGGKFGGLDKIPKLHRKAPAEFVGAAKAAYENNALQEYVIPHWNCGLIMTSWADNKAFVDALSFEDFCKAATETESPIQLAMWGSSNLGQLYADAVLDEKGSEWTIKHLIDLNAGIVQPDDAAVAKVLKLRSLLDQTNRENLEQYYNLSHYFPKQFALNKKAILIGYSERLYYVQDELQLLPKSSFPLLRPEQLVIKSFSFSAKSQGTPSWVDAFVIPKGKIESKAAAICAFLEFIQSSECYALFAEPSPYRAVSYLLPAKASAYEEGSPALASQPLLPQLLEVQKEAVPIVDSRVWNGMKVGGKAIRKKLETP